MRKLFCALFFWAGLTAPSAADQTDPRLDLLFEELRTGEARRAEENISRIAEIWSDAESDTVDLLYARAEESVMTGADDLAMTLINHVIGLAPNFAEGYAFRGMLRLETNDRAGAMEDFSKVLELEPRQFVVRLVLAGILEGSGAKREAYDMYQKVLEWNPHNEAAGQRARALRRDLDGQEI